MDYRVVISTDLSHFYSLKEAKKLDNICMHGIQRLDLDTLEQGCEACGKIGIKAIIKVAKEIGLKPNILYYNNSAEVNMDESSVVGYLSVQFV